MNYAVLAGNAELLDILLQRDYHPATVEMLGEALATASLRGYVEIVQKLLAIRDIDVNAIDDHSYTPLIGASEHGHKEVKYYHNLFPLFFGVCELTALLTFSWHIDCSDVVR